jgi:hypothetical protein
MCGRAEQGPSGPFIRPTTRLFATRVVSGLLCIKPSCVLSSQLIAVAACSPLRRSRPLLPSFTLCTVRVFAPDLRDGEWPPGICEGAVGEGREYFGAGPRARAEGSLPPSLHHPTLHKHTVPVVRLGFWSLGGNATCAVLLLPIWGCRARCPRRGA